MSQARTRITALRRGQAEFRPTLALDVLERCDDHRTESNGGLVSGGDFMLAGFPSDLTWYKLLTDWGGVIGGALAFVAGLLAYFAGMSQVWDARRQRKKQARGIAVAIQPELLRLTVPILAARKNLEMLKATQATITGGGVAGTIQTMAKLPSTVLLDRHAGSLHLLGDPAGPHCIHLHSMLVQYELVLQDAVHKIAALPAKLWEDIVDDEIVRYLGTIHRVREECEKEVKDLIGVGRLLW